MVLVIHDANVWLDCDAGVLHDDVRACVLEWLSELSPSSHVSVTEAVTVCAAANDAKEDRIDSWFVVRVMRQVAA